MNTNPSASTTALDRKRQTGKGERAAQNDGQLGVLRDRAIDLGFQCLSDGWTGYRSQYRFECASGHQFDRTATLVLYRDGGCLQCKRDAQAERWLANVAAKGGELVQGAFTGLLDRYQLRCGAGHEWEAQGRKIDEGSWCPTCARKETALRNRRSDGLAQLLATAQERGGKCFATAYTGGRSRYQFECAQGHRWEVQGSDVLRGNWCKLCACAAAGAAGIGRDGLARLQAAAQAHGGQCVADIYLGSAAKHRFRCAAGHEWSAVAAQVWRGHWCRRCANLKLRSTVVDMRALAAERGGLCLSDKYHGKRVKLTWQCHRGHVWESRPVNVRAGKWCPSCAILERIEKRNSWKRLRYEATGKLDG